MFPPYTLLKYCVSFQSSPDIYTLHCTTTSSPNLPYSAPGINAPGTCGTGFTGGASLTTL